MVPNQLYQRNQLNIDDILTAEYSFGLLITKNFLSHTLEALAT